MKSKTYVRVFILLLCAALVISCMTVLVLDPYLHYHAPLFGLQPVFVEMAYQNPGAAKHLEYDSIIVGSSLSENFDAQWFNDAFGIHTIKLPNDGASIENCRINISIAENVKDHKLKYVFGNLDNSVLDHIYNKPNVELPGYLYDDDVLNDISYLLNKDALLDCAKMVVRNLRHDVLPITQAYQWYKGPEQFSREIALKNIELPEVFSPIEQKSASVAENAVNGVRVLTELAEENPDTQFYFFYPPFNMIYWYSAYKKGNILSAIATLEYSMEQLLRYNNVHLFFPSTYAIITNLDLYLDYRHYNMDIQRLIFEQMRDGENELTKENYQRYMEEFRDMVLNCDFEKVFRG